MTATGSSWRAGFRDRGARLAVAVVAVMTIVALTAPLIAPFDPSAQPDVVGEANRPPSSAHWLGTDSFSRDVLSRVLHGSQVSLSVAALSVLLALTIGTLIGAAAGLAGGAVDRWLMRFVDAVLSVPRLLLLLVIAASFGHLSIGGLALVLGLTAWPGMSRIVRAQVRELSVSDYVTAARVLGMPSWRVLARHVIPGVLPQVLVAATLGVATVIPLEAGLSFLGLGVATPTPSWGNMILEGWEQRLQSWWLIVFPTLAILMTVLSVNVIGERLRDVVDPRLRPPV